MQYEVGLSPILLCVVWFMLERVLWYKRVLSQCVVDSHYVIMLTNVHTYSLYMYVTSSIGHGV